MPKRVKRVTKDLRALNRKVPGIHYPPDQDRAQLRGGKQKFALDLTRLKKASEGGQQ